jgi:hypothetical protein
MKKQKNIASNCCKDGKQVIYFFEKRKEYYLQYEGQDWWAIIKFCPWCGKKLDILSMFDDKTLEMDKF